MDTFKANIAKDEKLQEDLKKLKDSGLGTVVKSVTDTAVVTGGGAVAGAARKVAGAVGDGAGVVGGGISKMTEKLLNATDAVVDSKVGKAVGQGAASIKDTVGTIVKDEHKDTQLDLKPVRETKADPNAGTAVVLTDEQPESSGGLADLGFISERLNKYRHELNMSDNVVARRVGALLDAAANIKEALSSVVSPQREIDRVVAEIKRFDPKFELVAFEDKFTRLTVPAILKAYAAVMSRNDTSPMSTFGSEKMLNLIMVELKNDRLSDRFRHLRLMHNEAPEFITAKLMDRSSPMLMYRVQAQFISKIKNGKGEDLALQGDELPVQEYMFILAMMRDEVDPRQWRLHEYFPQRKNREGGFVPIA